MLRQMNTNDEILVFEDANGNELKVDTAKWKLRKGTREMNANELADELHKIYIQEAAECWDVVEEAATMLRQQQEKLTKYELRHVAQRDRIAILEMQHKQQQAEIESLKAKTLTDEEITEIFDTTFEVHDYQDSFIKFARAILRKAQEK